MTKTRFKCECSYDEISKADCQYHKNRKLKEDYRYNAQSSENCHVCGTFSHSHEHKMGELPQLKNSQEKGNKPCEQCEWDKLAPEPGHTCSTQPEGEGVEDWMKELAKKWPDDVMMERKVFSVIRELLEAQAKQIRQEERERAAGIVNDSLNLVRPPWGKMETTDFSPRACFWINTSRSETQIKILNPAQND